MNMSPRTFPLPVFATSREFCANGVSFDVFDKRKQMFVIFHHKRFVAPLIEVSGSDCLCTDVYMVCVCIGVQPLK